ncbi:MAG TPA: PDZ domain-containing protein [Puia sp.]|nr:PDZ domain-containing protein [Puia sp.]
MNKHLQKMAGLAGLVLALQTTGLAQDSSPLADDTAGNPRRGYDEIIIRHKTDKDAKVTIEIKNGQVFVNGKPASDFQDDNLSITKRKIRTMNGGPWTLMDGDRAITIAPSPFRSGGAWNFNGKILTDENRAFLGVTSIKPDNGPDGAKIGEVSPGSAAEKAGLKQGDLITRVDDITIDGPESLSDAIGRYKPEDKVSITYTRDGKEQKTTAVLGRNKNATVYRFRQAPNVDMYRDFREFMPRGNYNYNFNDNMGGSPRLGIHAQDTEDGKGVKVLDVDDESAAAKAGLKEGDIITRFDGKDVNSAGDLAQVARESRTKPSVHVTVLRGGKSMDLEVKIPRKLKTADL